jgi:hypothetical protein
MVCLGFPLVFFLSGCGAKHECESFETRSAVLQIVSNDHNNALATYAAKNLNMAKSNNANSAEREKRPPYTLGEKIVTTLSERRQANADM